MIRVRLKELIHEYGTSISEISDTTGINRASLTQIAEDKSKMVKFDTLDKLKLFFKMDYIYELFIDSDKATITVTPHKMIDNVLILDFDVNVQLTRDSEQIHQLFSVKFTLHSLTSKLYVFAGETVDQDKITNYESIKNMFASLHPVVSENFFEMLSRHLIKDASFSDGLSKSDNGGILPSELAENIIKNQSQLLFSMPDLDLVTALTCVHYVVANEYEEVDFFESPDMTHKFPDFELRSAPIHIKFKHPIYQ